MLGNLYVAARYWAYGYSDGMRHAGGVGKKRKRYLIGDRQYWATEAELPNLIFAAATKPQPEAKKPAKAPKRAQERTQPAAKVVEPAGLETAPQARLEAFRQQFAMADDEVLLRSLAIAAARLAEMEEDDEMVLLLA